jgi:hypothetical protein
VALRLPCWLRFSADPKRFDGVFISFTDTKHREKGKIIGGTKGNKILDYVSGAPTKEQVINEIPNVFDYSELERYGFGVSPKLLEK